MAPYTQGTDYTPLPHSHGEKVGETFEFCRPKLAVGVWVVCCCLQYSVFVSVTSTIQQPQQLSTPQSQIRHVWHQPATTAAIVCSIGPL